MRQITRFNYLSVILLLFLTYVPPLNAQDSRIEVHRTRTFPGIDNPAIPYGQPGEVGLSIKTLNRLGNSIVGWVADSLLTGAEVLIVKDGKAVFHEAYGWNDRDEGRPMRRDSIFSLFSMTKPVTATAALILIEQGRLSLDDRVSKYIPEVRNDSLLVRHLLAHKSGYQYWGEGSEEYGVDLRAHSSLKSWVKTFAAKGPRRPFGEYTYSDFNYSALGYIVEQISGVPVRQFTADHLLKPLGMTDTYTFFSPDTSSWTECVNDLYRWNSERQKYEKTWDISREMDAPWNFYGAAFGLFSTAMDYAAFMSMWINKGQWNGVRLLSEATVEEALRPHTRRGPERYGYGWKLRTSPQFPIVEGMPPAFYHGGFAGTLAMAFPAVDALVIYMSHSSGGNDRRIFRERLAELEIFDHPALDLMAGRVPVKELDVIGLTPEQLQRYVGSYRSENPEVQQEIVHKVIVENNHLKVRFWSPGSQEGDLLSLVPIGKHRFGVGRYRGGRLEAISYETEIRFIVEDGRVQGFEVLQGDLISFSAQWLK